MPKYLFLIAELIAVVKANRVIIARGRDDFLTDQFRGERT